MATKVSMKLGFINGENKSNSKTINYINAVATDDQLRTVARALEGMQKHTLSSVSKTVTTDVALQ